MFYDTHSGKKIVLVYDNPLHKRKKKISIATINYSIAFYNLRNTLCHETYFPKIWGAVYISMAFLFFYKVIL